MRLLHLLVIFVLLLSASAVQAQELTFDGYVDEIDTSSSHTFDLEAGQTALLVARAARGDLDTVLTLYDPAGDIVGESDDYARLTTDSALAYTAASSGAYTAVIEPYPDSGGGGYYRLTVTIGGEDLYDTLTDMTLHVLSGPVRVREAPAYRIHYTLEGQDRTTEAYVDELAAAMEQVYRVQIEELGWPMPPADGDAGGDDRFDIYVANLKNNDEVLYGYAQRGSAIGDNPNTPLVEEWAYDSYFVIENDFKESKSDNPLGLMRATLAHEFHHAIQFGFDFADEHDWVYEATAAFMEIVTAGMDQDAVRYVAYNFDYPELCFGTISDPTGEMMYGEWLFLQALADDYGPHIVRDMWDDIALEEGFDALAATLAAYDTTIPDALARYRAKNLVRAYELAPQFDATVWLENIINAPGTWSFTGEGIQELGANYFEIGFAGASYAVALDGPDALTLLAVGIAGDRADVYDLGRAGTISASGYDHVYLIVFHTGYGDVFNCAYVDYTLDVRAGSGAPARPVYTLDATHFTTLRLR